MTMLYLGMFRFGKKKALNTIITRRSLPTIWCPKTKKKLMKQYQTNIVSSLIRIKLL